MKVKKMRPLTHCDECGGQIWASNVFKTVAIPGSVGHLALVYRCSNCDEVGRAAASGEDWVKAQTVSEEHDYSLERALKAAHIEMQGIESVDDLLATWKTYPVLREEIMFLCKCKDCKTRLYNEA